MKRTLRVVRRDERFHETYRRTLQDIEERLPTLEPDARYAAAYGILRGFFEAVIDTCKETLPVDQFVEMSIILRALDTATREHEEKPKQ